nr:ribosomal protein L23 [Ostreobium sp. TRHA14-720]
MNKLITYPAFNKKFYMKIFNLIFILILFFLTEKSAKLLEKNYYTFFVNTKLTKIQIKSILEKLYKIDILSVKTCLPPKKKKRFSKFTGYKKKYKKAIIKIKSDQSIQILPKN